MAHNLGFGLPTGQEIQREIGHLRELIERVALNNASDWPSWRWDGNGKFTVSSAYSFISYDGIDDRSMRQLWSIKIPLRVKVFMWIAARNKLLTADRLMRRGWYGPSICVLCAANEERLEHILFDCPYASLLWKGLLQTVSNSGGHLLNAPGEVAVRWRRISRTLPGRIRGEFDVWFAAACWELWKERNRRLFDNEFTAIVGCGRRVVNTAQFWIEGL